MAQQQEQQFSEYEQLITDLNIKLRDIEEKQSIIKDRVLLIGQNLITEKEENQKEIFDLKNKITQVEEDIRKMKLTLQTVIETSNNFARKNEIDILKKQFKMFEPLELVRIKDVEQIVKKILNNLKE